MLALSFVLDLGCSCSLLFLSSNRSQIFIGKSVRMVKNVKIYKAWDYYYSCTNHCASRNKVGGRRTTRCHDIRQQNDTTKMCSGKMNIRTPLPHTIQISWLGCYFQSSLRLHKEHMKPENLKQPLPVIDAFMGLQGIRATRHPPFIMRA